MERISRNKALETCLVLTTAFLLLYYFKPLTIFLYIAFGFGIIGILITPLARIIGFAWFKLAEILNFIVSKIVLGSIFYLILFPISVLYRLTKKDPLKIRNPGESNWIERNHKYEAKDLKNIW